MLREIIRATKLPPDFCATLVGVDSQQFGEWLSGASPVPAFVVPELSAVLGIPEKQIADPAFSRNSDQNEKLTPAIWYKLRDERLTDEDREMVGLVRKLGFYLGQLQAVRGGRVLEYSPLFGTVRESIERSAPPSVQGSIAAQAFRNASGLRHGQVGIGEAIRGYFRVKGILVIETPLKNSQLEGCCFSVGTTTGSAPCIFANSFRSTWFRRNAVLLHELCHAIFDLDDNPVSIDFLESAAGTQPDFNEARAQAFAQECLLPESVVKQASNRFGIRWDRLTERDLGRLVANTHAEQTMVLNAACDAGLITPEQRSEYSALACNEHIKEFSDHALSTREYLKQRVGESPKWIAENRNTQIGTHSLRLPVRYVDEVIRALNDGVISLGKAAEMTMMEKQTFSNRFKDLIKDYAEV